MFFRGVFRCAFRPCVFEKVPLLQSAACQDTMVFTKDSNDFHVLRFSGQGQKNRDSGQNFDAKNLASSGQKFLENPMPKIMEFHRESTNFHENLHFSQETAKICRIFRNFWLFCTAPLPRSTLRRRRGTSRTAPEEHGAATGRP